MQWREEYNIGVDVVDKAHRQLFSIVRKMIELTEGGEKDEYACREGIRFFKSYTVRHFAEEEAHMRSIGYAGLERHRAIHENLKRETLPAMERRLEASGFSDEEVKRFIGICLGWLTAHVTNEDQAIAGKAKVKLPRLKRGETLLAMESIIPQIMQNTFGLESVLVNQNYAGWNRGPALFQELLYIAGDGKKTRVIIVLEEKFVLSTTGQMLGLRFAEVDETVRSAVRAISQTFVQRIDEVMAQGSQYRLVRELLLDEAEFDALWKDRSPQCSLLFFTMQGHYAFFFDELKDAGDLEEPEEEA